MLHSTASALAIAALLAALPAAAQLQEGQVVVLDKVADILIDVDPATGDQTQVETGGPISIPRGMDVDGSGLVYVAHTTPSPDFFRDFLRIIPGPLGIRTTFGTFGGTGFAEGIHVDPSGSFAVIPNPGVALGEVIERMDTFNGFRTVLAIGGYLSFPVGAVADVDGTYLWVDTNWRLGTANPPGSNDSFTYDAGRGVFRLDPTIAAGVDEVGGGPMGDEPDGIPDNQSVVSQTGENDSGYFVAPFRLLLASDGYIYVTDRGDTSEAPRVVRVDPSIAPDNDSDSNGIPDNQTIVSIGQLFDRPVGIAELAPGTLLVADGDAGLIEVDVTEPINETNNQTLVASRGLMDTPWEVHVVGPVAAPVFEPYYVTDAGALAVNDSVWLVDPSNDSRVKVSEAQFFDRPAGIAVDNDSTLVVVDPSSSSLVRVDPAGLPTNNQTEIWNNDSFSPQNLVVGLPAGGFPPEYFLVDPTTASVLRVLGDGSQEVLVPDNDTDYLVDPVAITLDGEGFLMVLDAGDPGSMLEGRIVRIDPTTGTQQCVGALPLLDDSLAITRALGVDSISPGAETYVVATATDNPILRLEIGPSAGILPSFVLASTAYGTPRGVVVDSGDDVVTPDAGAVGTPDDGVVKRLDVPDILPTDDPIGPPGFFVDPFGIALVSSEPQPVLGDADLDGVRDGEDNCLERDNPSQSDFDANGFGDACDLNADADGDGAVGLADFGAVVGEFGLSDCGGTDICTADFDGDTSVGLSDYGFLQLQFGNDQLGPALDLSARTSDPLCVAP